MEYYAVSIDKEYTDAPKTINWFGRIDIESILNCRYEKLEQAYALEIKENENVYKTDIIIEPIFAVSEMIKYCLTEFEPFMKFTRLYYVQRKEEKVFEYFIPHLIVQDCISKNISTNINNLYMGKLILDLNKIEEDKFIFRVMNGRTNYIIAREELIEPLYKRGARGIHIEKVETIRRK